VIVLVLEDCSKRSERSPKRIIPRIKYERDF